MMTETDGGLILAAAGDSIRRSVGKAVYYRLVSISTKRKLLTLAVLAFIGGLLVLFAAPEYRQGEPSLAGKAAPGFSFNLNGNPATLADLRGKVVVLNFWATWCPPCVEEAPSLERLQETIAPRGGTVLGISVDDDEAAYSKFLQDQHFTFPNYRDPSRRIALSYGTSMYPETYIIDRNGRLARKIIGPQDWDSPEIAAYLNQLLQAK
jgi:cytochrome c biogenesis protein CcmG, thiol:disulfide interchange protein DsbE